MSDKFKTVLIGILGTSCVVLIGVTIYQRLVMNQILHVAVQMYQFIQAGCPSSQIH